MFKRLLSVSSFAVVLSVPTTTFAQDIGNNNLNQMNQSMQSLGEYVLHLGAYLGYNLKQNPDNVQSGLIENINEMQIADILSITVLTGARPVDSLMKTLASSSISGMQYYNGMTNLAFTHPSYSTPKQTQGKVTVNRLVDQANYQNDPISQAVLNIMSTPNDSFCVSYDGTTYNSDCKLLTQGLVAINAVGTLSDPQSFFAYKTVKNLLPQLNSNSLTGPLLYSTEAQNQSPTSSPIPSSSNNQDKGLQTLSQAQAAQNFIRNVSGSLTLPTLPDQKTYDTYYSKAMNFSKKTSLLEQKAAQRELSEFMVQLRTYASQVSIGMSNLYYLLAKRMPQNPDNSSKNPTSEALSEFQMATGRLFNPDRKANQQWIQKINSASSATVQKEIAVLLAEINYQLYLNRQLQERMLMTNSVILLNSANQGKPDGSALGSTAGS